MKNEKEWPFVECAVYGDQIKRAGGGYQSQWHFDDEGFLKDPSSNLKFVNHEKNITSALPALHDWLAGKDVSSHWAHETIMKRADSEEEGKSIALRLLIHYYGDIHQPLHNTGRYDEEN